MKTLLLIVSLLLAGIAHADTDPGPIEQRPGCKVYTMCDAQVTTGDCTVLPTSGDERVVKVLSFSNLTFYGLQSVGAPYECNIVSNDEGHDAAVGVGFQVNSTSLTDLAPILSISGLFYHIWVNCPTIETSVTVTALVCSANR